MIQFVQNAASVALFFFFSLEVFSAPKIVSDSIHLAKVKQMLIDGTAPERTLEGYQFLLSEANQLLHIDNPTVTAKSIAPPTGNKHDYLSISRYWWPDPESPDGLPWIRKDGETNPETQIDAVDRHRLGVMTNGIKKLSLAYYFSEDERYAQKAASILNTWFLDDNTRMNPHLEFAQSVPGNPNGRRSGILDGRKICLVVPDAIKMLSASKHWTADQHLKMTQWFKEYFTWLTESDLGISGSEQNNNHGSWYRFQVASLALFLKNKPYVKKMIELAQQSLDEQLNNRGAQIHEIERTRSFFYSCFNLDALTRIAMLGDTIEMDMWNYESANGKSFSLAVNYLKHAIEEGDWPHPTKNDINLSNLLPVLIRMADHSASDEITDLLSRTINKLIEEERESAKKNPKLLEISLRYAIPY